MSTLPQWLPSARGNHGYIVRASRDTYTHRPITAQWLPSARGNHGYLVRAALFVIGSNTITNRAAHALGNHCGRRDVWHSNSHNMTDVWKL